MDAARFDGGQGSRLAHVFELFESLGQSAEFVAAQHRRGVACDGLMADAHGAPAVSVIKLLDAGLADVFHPASLAPAGSNALIDSKYNLTFAVRSSASWRNARGDSVGEAALAAAFAFEHARVRARADATLRRLADASRIFVFQPRVPLSHTVRRALLRSLRRYGDNALLLVGGGAQPGTPVAELLEPNLYAAALSSTAGEDHALAGIRVAEWESVCRQVLRLRPMPRTPALPRRAEPAAAAPAVPHSVPLAAALALHRDGKLADAVAAYRAVLAAEPELPEALHLLGLALDGLGQSGAGEEMIRKAIAGQPQARFHGNLGMVLFHQGKFDAALQAYQTALALRPDYPEALNNMGLALAAQDRFTEAVSAHRKALALRPDFAEAHLNLGHALGLLGEMLPAEAAFRNAFALRPGLNPAPQPGAPRRILYVAADAAMPGAQYRCARMAEAAAAAGWQASWHGLAEVRESDLRGLSVLVLWRAELTGPVCRMIALVRAAGGRVGLDLDDLICDPGLADGGAIDAIRSLGQDRAAVRAQFERVRQTLQAADFAVAATAELATAMRGAGLPVWVLPNGFDEASRHAARRAARQRRTGSGDGCVRLCYAAGTLTHQRDFALLAPALTEVLAARPAARLVLFRDPRSGDLVRLDEFPALQGFAPQIEWRNAVPLRDLPGELARCDINLAPLETGNPFTEAKSELKVFEAALAGLPTVASPAGPFRRAIVHGQSGLLADSQASWRGALLALIDDPVRRARMAATAYGHAVWRFGPQYRAIEVGGMLAELVGGRGAALAFAAALNRPADALPPDLPFATHAFEKDDMADSAVTVHVMVQQNSTGQETIATLAGVLAQSLRDLDLVLTLPPGSAILPVAQAWIAQNGARFHRAALLQLDTVQTGPHPANAGFGWAETPWVLLLTAGQTPLPGLVAALLMAAGRAGAGFAYLAPHANPVGPLAARAARHDPRHPDSGSPLPGPALVAVWAWSAAGGWRAGADGAPEGAPFWRAIAALGIAGVAAPQVLATAPALPPPALPPPALPPPAGFVIVADQMTPSLSTG